MRTEDERCPFPQKQSGAVRRPPRRLVRAKARSYWFAVAVSVAG
jgi:hypothetical protein